MVERAVILGEDRAHRQFLNALCSRVGLPVVAEHIAPKGAGAASQWVVEQFQTRYLEVTNPRVEGIGLVVCIDGDNLGFEQRRRALLARIVARQPGPVAILVPTWSIETWLRFFDGQRCDECASNKGSTSHFFRQMRRSRIAPGVDVGSRPAPTLLPQSIGILVDGFLSDRRHNDLPALDRSREQWAALRGA